MRDKILEYYKSLLAVGWMYPDDDGYIAVRAGDLEMIPTLQGKRIVLPTREQMKNPDFDNLVRFHPLREHLNLGESDVLAEFRKQVSNRLSTSVEYLMGKLLALADDQEQHKNLSSEQGQVLNVLPKVKKGRTLQAFDELVKKVRLTNGEYNFVNIFIKRGGTIKGHAYNRVGVVTFPLYKELCDAEGKVVNTKLSNEDRAMFRGLYEYVFPQLLTDPEWFNVGVNTRTAPNLEAFVRVTIRLINDLKEVSRLYADVIPGLQVAMDFPENLNDWIDLFDDADAVERAASSIPSQKGNEGTDLDKEKEKQRKTEKPRERAVEKSITITTETKPEPEPAEAKQEETKPRGIMRIGNPSSAPLNAANQTQAAKQPANQAPPQSGLNHSEIERLRRENEARRREEEEYNDDRRRRRSRDRDDDDDDEDDRRRRRRDRDDDRDDRDRDRRRRDRDDDRDDRRGDAWDNPVLSRNLDDARDDERYGRRSRDRDDDRYDRRRDRYDDRRDGRRGYYDYDDDDRYRRRRR